jgi:hypothetical protein
MSKASKTFNGLLTGLLLNALVPTANAAEPEKTPQVASVVNSPMTGELVAC